MKDLRLIINIFVSLGKLGTVVSTCYLLLLANGVQPILKLNRSS